MTSLLNDAVASADRGRIYLCTRQEPAVGRSLIRFDIAQMGVSLPPLPNEACLSPGRAEKDVRKEVIAGPGASMAGTLAESLGGRIEIRRTEGHGFAYSVIMPGDRIGACAQVSPGLNDSDLRPAAGDAPAIGPVFGG